jgi:signal transduction histidine kinase
MKTKRFYGMVSKGTVVIVGIIFVIIYMTYQTQKKYQDIIVSQTQRQLLTTAKSAAKSLEDFFRMQQGVLKSFASDPLLLTLGPDTNYSQLELRYKELKGDIGGFYIISSKGIVTHRYPNKDRVGMDFSNKPGVSTVLKTHKPYVSDLFYSSSGKTCLTVLEPILREGEFIGIVRALTYTETVQKKYLESVKVGKRGYAWAVNDDGLMVMHPKSEHIAKDVIAVRKEKFPDYDWAQLEKVVEKMTNGHEGISTYHSAWWTEKELEIVKKITAYAPVHIGNKLWSIAVSMGYSEVLAPIKKHARNTFGLAVVIVLLLTAVGYIFYRKQKREAVLEAEAENLRKISETAEALRESEEKLARSKKMESLGLLAGGVAHDLNNVLSGIVSYPELLLMDLPEDSKLRKPIETIQESGHRAAAIVQDLLTVARGVATTKKPLNLNDMVSGYLHSAEFSMLKQFHSTVTVKTDLDTDLFNIGGSYEHIRKVVMNLVSNAAEAIASRGNVTIATMNCYMDRPLSGYTDVNIGEYVLLSVSDDGSGISSDELERIFEPFYTKKVMGRSGTGLGLAVVWNTVQDHHGYVDVKSDKNGTTFELYFPITRDEIADKDLSIPIKDYKGDGETILVVDDVESQRDISCKMLDKLGYKTKAVSSGEEAVEYIKENTVDLLLLDMIMDPGINGRETYERIINIHPNQKAIIASGFAETDDVKAAQKLGAGKYIKKPLTLEMIGPAVKEELEK